MSKQLLLHEALMFSRIIAREIARLQSEQDSLIAQQRLGFSRIRSQEIRAIDEQLRDLDDCAKFIKAHCGDSLSGGIRRDFSNSMYKYANQFMEEFRSNDR